MKKLVWGVLLVIGITGCKTAGHKCDAYGMQEEDDINIENVESQKKFVTTCTIK